MLEPAQIEVLILKRVRQLVRHDRPLTIEINPVSQMKFASLRIVIAGHLFSEHAQNQGPVLKVRWRQAQPFQSDLGRAHLRRRCFLVQVHHEHALDLGARLDRALYRAQDRQLSNLAGLFEDVAGRRNQGGIACGSR